jgi:hypothetical protein
VGEVGVRGLGAALAGCALGDTGDWYGLYARPEEAYVWRAQLVGADIRDPEDALAVLASFGQTQNLKLNVQGICIQKQQDGAVVDVVLTTTSLKVYVISAPVPMFTAQSAEEIATGMLGDRSLRERFPQLSIRTAELLQITAPPAAIDFWRSHATLWDPSLGQTGQGGPTQAFANLTGAYLGAADDGPGLKPWKVAKPGLGPDQDKDSDATVFWVIGGLALAWLVVRSIGSGAS